ncbi:MFS transporter [Rhodococcoides kyotonense]|uniref:MFS transporter n=1 Tax=Rhodococcoides kyotonense TaxID=398843 RepID=A0A177YM34_9NOCA|nr:MFS transporter [Rhodococcus kyotonensis]OAK56666.1 MFS transporter [Rhodococcus kyotonensis]
MPLADSRFRRLFTAQILALIGTGLTTVALGLAAFDIAGSDAGAVLGTALGVKMVAYVAVSPVASALTARVNRTTVLVAADAVRAASVLVLPFVVHPWQIYALVFVLQSASATFTPAFQSTIPALLREDVAYTKALSLSRLAYDLESIVSPMVAAALLTVVSYHVLFVGTAAGFAASMSMVLSARLPSMRSVDPVPFRTRITSGARDFVTRAPLRGVAAMNLVAAAVTSVVVVDTVVYVRARLDGSADQVALLLGCFGAGSIAVAVCLPRLLKRVSDRTVMLTGCAVAALTTACTTIFAVVVTTGPIAWICLAVLWVGAGAAASAIGTPTARVIRRCAAADELTALFTAQFSLSHACFLLTYPIVGWVGAAAGQSVSTAISAVLATLATIAASLLWRSSEGGGDDRIGADSKSESRPRDEPGPRPAGIRQ